MRKLKGESREKKVQKKRAFYCIIITTGGSARRGVVYGVRKPVILSNKQLGKWIYIIWSLTTILPTKLAGWLCMYIFVCVDKHDMITNLVCVLLWLLYTISVLVFYFFLLFFSIFLQRTSQDAFHWYSHTRVAFASFTFSSFRMIIICIEMKQQHVAVHTLTRTNSRVVLHIGTLK